VEELGSAERVLDSVERALDAVEAEGARMFDAPSCDCVRALLTRAEELGGRTGELLAERAHVHVERLAARLAAARADTEQRIATLEQQRGPLPLLRELAARGELARVRRALRKLAASPVATRIARASLPREPADEGVPERPDYEGSLAELVASFALARAVDVVPEDAGPYNPLRIASELLERMRTVSPLYLTAQLNRLEELASLLALPELPSADTPTLPRKKRGALKGGSS